MSAAEYQKVHTVMDYWDGARPGIADFNGQPYYYERLFDDSRDDWSEVFLLHPIERETLLLALEDWQIWERWYAAHEEGRASVDSHPALPEERARHQEITELIKGRLEVDPHKDLRATAEFEVVEPKGKNRSMAILKVRWNVVF